MPLLTVGLALAPCRAWAQPATDAAPATEVEGRELADPEPSPEDTEVESDLEATDNEPLDNADNEPPAADANANASVDADASVDTDADASVDADADASVDTDADDTDEAPVENTAAPLRPMQSAAWWTMFGGFALGTTAGVLAGLAERQEDRAARLASLFDTNTGAQLRYADRQDEYEGYLDRGNAYAKAALGVGVVAGVTTIAAVALFVVDARRQRHDKTTARRTFRVRTGGLEVRF